MRRMNTQDSIIEAVNQGIESGKIEVGGGLPEIEEGDAGKVLKVNEAEDGVEWGEAGGSGENVLILDFKNQSTLIDSDAQAILRAGTYGRVKVINYGQPNRNVEFRKTPISGISVTGSTANITPSITFSSSPNYILEGNWKAFFNSDATAQSEGRDANIGYYRNFPITEPVIILSYSGSSIKIVTKSQGNNIFGGILSYTSQTLDINGGTLAAGNYPTLDYSWNAPRPYTNLTYAVVDSTIDANSHILMKVSRYDRTNKIIYIFGQYIDDSTGAVTASYTGTINCTNGVYTITKHTA